MNHKYIAAFAMPEVTLAMEKLAATGSTRTLSIEEILLCYYEKPLEIVPENWDTRFKRGSVLVYPDKVVCVAAAHRGQTEHISHRRRFITPQRKYGVLPGSRFFTMETHVTVIESAEEVRGWRAILRHHGRKQGRDESKADFFAPNAAGSLRVPRCPEEARLWGRLSAGQLMKAFSGAGAD